MTDKFKSKYNIAQLGFFKKKKPIIGKGDGKISLQAVFDLDDLTDSIAKRLNIISASIKRRPLTRALPSICGVKT